MSVQLPKSGLCCNPKSADGTVHETMKLPVAGVMFIRGAGVDCQVQIPPPFTVATNLLPSDDEAMEDQFALGALFEIQVTAESVEV